MEECPYGEESRLPEDRPIFDITSPTGTNPEDALPGSVLSLNRGQRIMITLVGQPEEFLLMDLEFVTTAPVTVTITFKDSSDIVKNVSYASQLS